MNTSKKIINQIGETDQLYIAENTPNLALKRAQLRLELVMISSLKQEQIHFLQEAIVLLEQARIEYEDIALELYIDISLELAKAYMIFFELTGESKYALVTQHILKPIQQHENSDIYFLLAYASISKNEPAMTQHWLKKYTKTDHADLALLHQHSAFNSIRHHDWFHQLIQSRLH